MADDRVVDSFRRTPTEEVRATLRTYRGKRYMDVRIYYLDDAGEFRPTKKGVNLSVEFLPDLTAMIDKLAKAVAEDGDVAEERPRTRRAPRRDAGAVPGAAASEPSTVG